MAVRDLLRHFPSDAESLSGRVKLLKIELTTSTGALVVY